MKPLLIPFGALFVASSAFSAQITLIGDNTGGFGGQNWNQADDWSNNAAPSAGNDYHVGSGAGKNLEAPTGSPPPFAGDSLTIHATGSLRFRTSSTVTIGSLILNGGALNNFLTGRVTLAATSLSVTANSTITANNTDSRDWTFNQTLSGSGGLTLAGANINNEFRFNGDGSAYSGNWTVDGGTLLGFGTGSLGSGNLVIGGGVNTGGSRLDARYDIANSGSSLTLNTDATMVLNNNHTFGSLTIGATSLAPGAYTFNYLNTNFDTFFVDGGIGSITVVPEPQTSALLVGSVGLWLTTMRRKNRRVRA